MRIFFGSYLSKIKTYELEDLNISEEEYSDYTFIAYVKVFHLIGIPLFPLDKTWKIRNHFGNIIDITDTTLRHKLNLVLLKMKYPLWTYFGSVVLALPFIFLTINLMFSLFDTNKELTEYEMQKSRKERIINKIGNPSIGDTYSFVVDRSGFKEYLKYELVSVKQDSFTLSLKEKISRVTPELNYNDTIKIWKEIIYKELQKENMLDNCSFSIKHLISDYKDKFINPSFTIKSIK
mgnify:CR=1 FL=1